MRRTSLMKLNIGYYRFNKEVVGASGYIVWVPLSLFLPDGFLPVSSLTEVLLYAFHIGPVHPTFFFHLILFGCNHFSKIWWQARIVQHFTMQYSPFSCNFLPHFFHVFPAAISPQTYWSYAFTAGWCTTFHNRTVRNRNYFTDIVTNYRWKW